MSLTIYLADLMYKNDGVGNKGIPLNIGFLASYLNARLSGQVCVRLFKDPEALLSFVKSDPPHILGLSNYPWTRNLSLETFKVLKRAQPSLITVMGGPNYPDEPHKQVRFMAEREYLDFYTYKESEQTFAGLVSRLLECGLDVGEAKRAPISGVHFYDRRERRLVKGEFIARLVDLDTIPSPYLTGLFDEFIAADLQPWIQTNRGCPFTCAFCVEGDDYYTKVRRFSLQRITAELEYIAKRVRRELPLHIVDSNFGMYEEDIGTCRVLRRLQDEYGWPYDVYVSSGKNKTERVVEASRITRGAISISLQVQSMDSEVLKNIRRKNISVESMVEALKQTQSLSKTTRAFSAVIIPLPGETLTSHFEGLRKLIELDMDYICPYTLMILNGTELATDRSRDRFGMQTKFRTIPNYYGTYGELSAIEVEEVCVSTNTMSFEDYIQARGMHFFLGCFHADDNMLELRRYLGNFGISTFDWLCRLKANIDTAPAGVRTIYRDFLQATVDELWDSEEELLAFWGVPKNRDRFIIGDLGDNLFFKFRAKAITSAFRDLVDFGATVGIEMVLERNPAYDAKTIRLEMAELADYVYFKRRLPIRIEEITSDSVSIFTHDFVAWEAERYARPLSEFRSESPIPVTFGYSEFQQKKLIVAYEANGTSPQGIGMLLREHNPLFFVRESWKAAYVGIDMPVREPLAGRFDVPVPPGGSFQH